MLRPHADCRHDNTERSKPFRLSNATSQVENMGRNTHTQHASDRCALTTPVCMSAAKHAKQLLMSWTKRMAKPRVDRTCQPACMRQYRQPLLRSREGIPPRTTSRLLCPAHGPHICHGASSTMHETSAIGQGCYYYLYYYETITWFPFPYGRGTSSSTFMASLQSCSHQEILVRALDPINC